MTSAGVVLTRFASRSTAALLAAAAAAGAERVFRKTSRNIRATPDLCLDYTPRSQNKGGTPRRRWSIASSWRHGKMQTPN